MLASAAYDDSGLGGRSVKLPESSLEHPAI